MNLGSSEVSNKRFQGDRAQEKVLLKVNTCKKHTLSTTLVVSSSTSAGDVCRLLGSKLEVPVNDLDRHCLIAVRTNMRGKVSYTLRTLRKDDLVLEFGASFQKRGGQGSSRSVLRWYFKDSHTAPLSFDGNLSGDDDDEDEDEDEDDHDDDETVEVEEQEPTPDVRNDESKAVTDRVGDLSVSSTDLDYVYGVTGRRRDEHQARLPLKEYMRLGSRTGLVLVRSRRDENLWCKRLLVFGESVWCFNTSSDPPRKRIIDIDGTTDIISLPVYRGVHNVIVIEKPHEKEQGSIIAMGSQSERLSWAKELRAYAEHRRDNDMIAQAEMLVTDEGYVRLQHAHESLQPLLDGDVVRCMLQDGYDGLWRMGSGHLKMNTDVLACYPASSGGDALDMKFLRKRNWFALRSVCQSGGALREIVSFILAVERYKDAFRVDVLLDPLVVWKEALRVHVQFFRERTGINGDNSSSSSSSSSSSRTWTKSICWPPSRDTLQVVTAIIEESFTFVDVALKDDASREVGGLHMNSILVRTRPSVTPGDLGAMNGIPGDPSGVDPAASPTPQAPKSASVSPMFQFRSLGDFFGVGTGEDDEDGCDDDRLSGVRSSESRASMNVSVLEHTTEVRVEMPYFVRVYSSVVSSGSMKRPPLGMFDRAVQEVLDSFEKS